jgi:exosortase
MRLGEFRVLTLSAADDLAKHVQRSLAEKLLFCVVCHRIRSRVLGPIRQLIDFASFHDYGSHILLIAPLSIFLVYLRRDEILPDIQASSDRKGTMIAGSSLFLLGLVLLSPDRHYSFLRTERLSVEILSLVVLWMSSFILCYGRQAFVKARFPLLLLLLLVPVPDFLIGKAIFSLQVGSSDVAYGLLRFLSVPVLKDGFILRLPMLDLEVAKECSGIRSSVALLLTVLVAAEFVLRSSWRKMLLVIATIPILILKNGIRIVSIYLLAAYVNPAFLHGWLHTSGGVIFYLLGVVTLIPIAALLKRGEGGDFKSSPPKLAEVSST